MDEKLVKNLQEQVMYSLVNRVFQMNSLDIDQKKEKVISLGKKLGKKSFLLMNKNSLSSGNSTQKDSLKGLIEDLWPNLFGKPTDVFFPGRETASFKENDFRFIKRVDSNFLDPDEQKEYVLLLLVFIEGILLGALQSLLIEFSLEVIYKNECLFVHIDLTNDIH